MSDNPHEEILRKIEAFFSPRGTLAKKLEGYELRPGQATMAASVLQTLHEGGVLIVEAGTGTGKTLAYLVPVLAAGKKVVISTGTKNLQEQLFFTDIPFLQELGGEFAAAIMKGRGNYLCLRKAKLFRSQPMLKGLEEVNQFRRLDQWAGETETGDFAELSELPENSSLFRRLSCSADNCIGRKCGDYQECWLVKARERAMKADILVVNHHLLFADMSVREGGFGEVLPEYDYVVFDEAHEIEHVATTYFGMEVSNRQLDELARDTSSELVAEQLDDPELEKHAGECASASTSFFAALPEQADRKRLIPEDFKGSEKQFQNLYDALETFEAHITENKDYPDAIQLLARRAHDLRMALQLIVDAADPAFVFYVEKRGKGVYLKASPIDVSSIIRQTVVEQNEATVMVSATLAVQNSFDYMQERLGIDDATTRQLGSPYDYQKNTRFYVPRTFPDPNDRAFPAAVAEQVAEMLKITEGRSFVLFTSYRNLNMVGALLKDKVDYPLLIQGTASKRALLEEYMESDTPVLLATYSFWQGVDVRGDQLSQVIIDKIPFAVPDDPLLSARIDRIKEAGGNAFFQLQVPHAALMLKQGLGRLVRSSTDRGIMAVLDNRLLTRRYGRTILDSLYGSPLVSDTGTLRLWWQNK